MTDEREIILPVTLTQLLALTKGRLEKTELILSIKSLTLSSGTFMEWSSEFHNNRRKHGMMVGVHILILAVVVLMPVLYYIH
jgi:hypothetical protein